VTTAPHPSMKDLPPTGLKMKEALAIIDCLNPDACARYDWNKLRFFISQLIGSKYYPSFQDTPRHPMIRGRSVPMQQAGRYGREPAVRLLKNVSEFGPLPPERVTNYGRCHIPKSPVFYAAFNEDTVLAEIRPEVGSLVYLMTCEPKPDVKFDSVSVGEIDHIRRYGTSRLLAESPQIADIREWLKRVANEDHYVRVVTDAFLASLMSRKTATQDDYKATSALCGLLLALETDDPGPAEAIYYPSVAHQGGMNIALTYKCFHEKVNPVSCKVIHVQNYFGMGIYKSYVVATSENIEPDGTIAWKPRTTIVTSFIAT